MITADILGERSRLTPDKTALVYEPTGERFSYAQLDARASHCAQFWMEVCGLRKGERVGILAHNRIEFIEAFFGAVKSGLILVPLNTRYTPQELQPIVEDSGLKALLYDGELAASVRALKEIVAVKHWIALDEPLDPSELAYRETLAAPPQAGWQPVRCDPEDLCCLFYTSGTTGKPKGVMIPHRMVAWNACNTALSWQLREDDTSPLFTPLYHAGGLGVFLTPLWAVGGSIILHRHFEASAIWRAIEQEKCTVVFGVPTIFKLLMEVPEFTRVDLRHVRWFISGGAPLPLHLIHAYQQRGIVLKQGYGLTEVGVNCFAMTTEEATRKAGSIGKPLLFTEARIATAAGNDLPAGEVGELLLRGPHVYRGYWNDPEATAAALDAEGWFHTGDLARRDDEGFFYIAGRLKDMFISGGVNVYPAEIENELLLHPAIEDAAVIGIPHATWGEVGVAFVVRRAGHGTSPEELAQFLAGRLAKYKVPREFLFVASLPRTPYGKVIKGALRERYLQFWPRGGATGGGRV